MQFCGITVGPEFHHLCSLEEVRTPEPPIRLQATFYEPGSAADVVATVRALGDVAVAVGAPRGTPTDGHEIRVCDAELERRGVAPQPFLEAGLALFAALDDLGVYSGPAAGAADDGEGPAAIEGGVEEGAYRSAAVFEVNLDGVFCAFQGRRVPAKRHPLGVIRRIEELVEDHVEDPGGELWHRRIEEVEAAGAALAAHRYAVAHACWLGDPAEGVVVLPGARPPAAFSVEGVLPPVERVPLANGG